MSTVRLFGLYLWITVSLLATAACQPASPAHGGHDAGSCTDRASCEAALVASQASTSHIAAKRYLAQAPEGWQAAWQALQSQKERPLVLRWPGAASPSGGVISVELPEALHTERHSVDDVLLALGRAADHQHIVVIDGASVRHLFPKDVLAPHMLALAPTIRGVLGQLPAELALSARLRDAIQAAARFDYVSAAKHAMTLDALVPTATTISETHQRARFGLVLLRRAGIALGEPTDTAFTPSSKPGSSPYADAIQLWLASSGPRPKLAGVLERVAASLDEKRGNLLRRKFRHDDDCAPTPPPAFHSLGDLAFTAQLLNALDPSRDPAAPPAAGKLSLEDWLKRYRRAVDLIAEDHSMWSYAPLLLARRPADGPKGSHEDATYLRVTELALKHLGALEALAAKHPAQFQPLWAMTLAHQAGAWSDPRLRPVVKRLARTTLQAKLQHSKTIADLYEISVSTFAASASAPPELQKHQLTALRDALHHKLKGELGDHHGWGVAGLYAAEHALAQLLGGDGSKLSQAARQISRALNHGDAQEPALARLVSAAASYTALAARGSLDASVANLSLFPPERLAARKALREAIATMAPSGPASAPERELLEMSLNLADGLAAAVIADLQRQKDGPSCQKKGRIPAGTPLRDAFDRLRKKRRELLAHDLFETAAKRPWLQRARLLSLVLSDTLDVADRRGESARFSVPAQQAEKILRGGSRATAETGLSKLLTSLYPALRHTFSGEEIDQKRVAGHALRALDAVASFFDTDTKRPSLLKSLAALGKRADSIRSPEQLRGALVSRASKSYATGAHDNGDVLLLLALTSAIASEVPIGEDAVTLARKLNRPVLLPLLLSRAKGSPAPEAIGKAMRAATSGRCRAPDPGAVIIVRQAIADFRAGRRDLALRNLDRLLARLPQDGLVVPRQIFRYEQHHGTRVFHAEQSFSFGRQLLKGAGAFNLGLGFQSQANHGESLKVTLGKAETSEAAEEALRFYAHANAVAAVYHYIEGQTDAGSRAARRAVEAWSIGTNLGGKRTSALGKAGSWTRDAGGLLAIMAQQAADTDDVFLAGDLWTLVSASLDKSADDEAITALLTPLPPQIRGLKGMQGLRSRTLASLRLVAAKLPCTDKRGKLQALQRVSCARYPQALALRVADALPFLPRLKQDGASRSKSCSHWRSLDRFLGSVAEKRYDPDQFMRAVANLQARKRPADAALLLARHRHPRHCSPKLTEIARQLATDETLRSNLRADLLTVAIRCGSKDDRDLLQLDKLSRRHPLPERNYEVLIFAAQRAHREGKWNALYSMTHRPGFLNQYRTINPRLGAAAVLLHQLSALGAQQKAELSSAQPYYRLLCLTFGASDDRASTCKAIGRLLKPSAKGDDAAMAKSMLGDLLARLQRQPKKGAPAP